MTLPRPLLIAFACSAGLLLALFPFLLFTIGLTGDFLAFYTAGQTVWRGALARLYDADLFLAWQQGITNGVVRPYRYVYLPAFISYYLPLAALPPVAARVGGALLGALLLGIALRISRAWHALAWGAMVLAVAAFPGSYAAFVVVQNSPLTLVLMSAITIWIAYRRRPVAAGVAAGLLLYKPQLLVGLAVVWLVQRAWRELAVWLGMGLGWLAVSWFIAPTVTASFFGLGRELMGSLTEITDANASLYALFADLLPPAAALGIAGGVAVVVLGMLAWVWWKYPASPFRLPLLWLSVFLVPPYIANYDLMLLLLPISLLVPLIPRHRGLQAAVALLWVGPAVTLIAPTVRWVPAALLLLFGLCVWYATRVNPPVDGGTRTP